jgi:hypothetical protein
MATLLLAAGGAAAGGAIFGTQAAISIGWVLGSVLGMLFFGPKSEIAQGPRLNDLRVQASTYGQMQTYIFGTMRVPAEVIWSTYIIEHKNDVDFGKGGGGTQIFFWYDISIACAWSEGPVDGIIRIWANTKLVQDNRPESRTRQKYDKPIRNYFGTEVQLNDPLIEGDVGANIAVPYRKLCYTVFEDFPLIDTANAVPNFTAEVARTGSPGQHVDVLHGEDFNSPLQSSPSLLMDPRPSVRQLYTWTRADFISGVHTNPSYIHKIDDFKCAIVNTQATYNHWGIISSRDQPDMDDEGYIYGHGQGGLTFVRQPITKYSAESLLPIANAITLSGETIFVVAGHFRVDKYSGQKFLWHISHGPRNHGNLTGIFRTGMVQAYYVPRGTFGVDGWALEGGWLVEDMDGDGDGNCYLCVRSLEDNNITRIYRVTPSGAASITAEIEGINADSIMYVPFDDTLILSNGADKLMKYDIGLGVVTHTLNLRITYNRMSFHNGFTSAHTFWLASYEADITVPGYIPIQMLPHWPKFYEINAETLTVVQSRRFDTSMLRHIPMQRPPDPFRPVKNIKFFNPGNALYDESLNVIWAVEQGLSGVGRFALGAVGECMRLDEVVIDITERMGRTAADLDVTALEQDFVCGYAPSRVAPGRQILDHLLRAYLFAYIESGAVIKSVKLGGSSVITIPEGDLAAHESSDERPLGSIEETRLEQVRLPQRITIEYISKIHQYEQASQYAKRLANGLGTDEHLVIELPMVLTSTYAQNLAAVILEMSWIERTTYHFTLPPKYLRLEPMDVITLQLDSLNINLLIRITQVEFGANGLLDIRGEAADIAAYDPTLLVHDHADGLPTGDIIPPIGNTIFYLMDIPMIRSDDNDEGFYMAVTPELGESSAWKGAVVFRSADQGENWNPIAALGNEATIGITLTQLEEPVAWTVWDESSTVDIQLFYGTLIDANHTQVLNGQNMVLIGAEIIQFRTAELLSARFNQWRLSGLLRGRLGTEWAVDQHGQYEKIVFIQLHVLSRYRRGDIGAERLYRAATFNTDFDSSTVHTFTNTGVALRPYSPTYIQASDVGGGDIQISWLRRTRIHGEWLRRLFVPIGEEVEAYEVEILSPTGSILRIFEVDTTQVTYLVAQQAGDGWVPPMHVRVYQISNTVGRGYAGEAVIDIG